MSTEFDVTTCPDRKASKQRIQRVPNRPSVSVWPKVPRAFVAYTTAHHRARPFVRHGHCQKWIAFVIAESNVESWTMLFDQVVLEHEGFDFVAHLNPLDARRARHHLRGPRMQHRGILKVVT